MLRGLATPGKANNPRMVAPTAKELQIRKQPPTIPSGQRNKGDKKVLPTPPPPHAKSATAKATESASSHGGDSTATKNAAALSSEQLLRSVSGDAVQNCRSMSSTEMTSLEEVSTEELSDRDELYRNVKDLLGEVLAGIDIECTCKGDKQQGMAVPVESERIGAAVNATEEHIATELHPTVAPPTGRTGVGRASCDLTVRFADSDGTAKSRPESPASASSPRKKTAGAQAPAIKTKIQPPQPQQGMSLWPFRRNKVNTAAKANRNVAAASVNAQSKQTPRRDSIGQTVDSELLAAMDRKISWGKAKAYPGSVTLSELNDDGTGTSKTRSLRRIKKRRPTATETQTKSKSEGGISLLRSILGIVSSSQKAAAAPQRPQAKGAAKRPVKQQSTGPRQSGEKGSPSGSKASEKSQQRKEKKAAAMEPPTKGNQPLPPLKEVPEKVVTPDDARTSADDTEARVSQLAGVREHMAADAVAADTSAVQEHAAEAAGGQRASSGPETWIVSASGD